MRPKKLGLSLKNVIVWADNEYWARASANRYSLFINQNHTEGANPRRAVSIDGIYNNAQEVECILVSDKVSIERLESNLNIIDVTFEGTKYVLQRDHAEGLSDKAE